MSATTAQIGMLILLCMAVAALIVLAVISYRILHTAILRHKELRYIAALQEWTADVRINPSAPRPKRRDFL